jgi:hypothetical protein
MPKLVPFENPRMGKRYVNPQAVRMVRQDEHNPSNSFIVFIDGAEILVDMHIAAVVEALENTQQATT